MLEDARVRLLTAGAGTDDEVPKARIETEMAYLPALLVFRIPIRDYAEMVETRQPGERLLHAIKEAQRLVIVTDQLERRHPGRLIEQTQLFQHTAHAHRRPGLGQR